MGKSGCYDQMSHNVSIHVGLYAVSSSLSLGSGPDKFVCYAQQPYKHCTRDVHLSLSNYLSSLVVRLPLDSLVGRSGCCALSLHIPYMNE